MRLCSLFALCGGGCVHRCYSLFRGTVEGKGKERVVNLRGRVALLVRGDRVFFVERQLASFWGFARSIAVSFLPSTTTPPYDLKTFPEFCAK